MQDSYYVLLSHTWYYYSNKIGWVITPQIYATQYRYLLLRMIFKRTYTTKTNLNAEKLFHHELREARSVSRSVDT